MTSTPAAAPAARRRPPWRLIAFVVLVAAVVGGGAYGWWMLVERWKPKTIDKHAAEITQILERSGWVAPGRSGKRLYMVSFRTCPDCIRFHDEQFPDLAEANVDTRVIMIARADVDGQAKSTPVERATVAELWSNRSWNLMERWYAARPAQAWTGEGIPPADGDIARTAVVEAGRRTVEQLRPLLADNGISFAYPTLIWWDEQGRMRGCACEKRETYGHVRRELGL